MNKITHIDNPVSYYEQRNNIKHNEAYGLSYIDYIQNIGKKCFKLSGSKGCQPKPFKSGSKEEVIKGVIEHPILHIPAYVFEDCTFVECRRIFVPEGQEIENFNKRFTIDNDNTIKSYWTKKELECIISNPNNKITSKVAHKIILQLFKEVEELEKFKNLGHGI